MSEQLGQQIQDMFKSIYDATDLKYLRPLKRHTFKCGLECLDDKNSIKEAESCIDRCGVPMHKAMSFMQNEINSFQGRIDRCLMDCQDSVRKTKDEEKARRAFDSCAEGCIKKHIPIVKEVNKTIAEGLEKITATL